MKAKKILSVLLCVLRVAALCGGLSRREQEPKPLRFLLDLTFVPGGPDNDLGLDLLAAEVKAAGGPEDIEFEVVPSNLEERQMLFTRIRTEIMAGSGPDLFIMSCVNRPDEYSPLFLMPEKSLELGLFLDLDPYIERAQFMEWDAFNPTVMAAGRSEKFGQGIIPLSYTFPVTFFTGDVLTHTPSKDVTWQDMLQDENLRLAASPLVMWGDDRGGSESFGPLADFAARRLLITEEDLLQRVNEYLELDREFAASAQGTPSFHKTAMQVNYNESSMITYVLAGTLEFKSNYYGNFAQTAKESGTSVTMVPVYTDDGGVTATVHNWAAINASTKRPDDAFFVLDYLLSKNSMRFSPLMTCVTDGAGVSVRDDFMRMTTTVNTRYDGAWYMEDEAYEAFSGMRESITHVKFCGTLETEIEELVWQCRSTTGDVVEFVDGPSEKTVEELVHEFYARMQKEISE